MYSDSGVVRIKLSYFRETLPVNTPLRPITAQCDIIIFTFYPRRDPFAEIRQNDARASVSYVQYILSIYN